MHCTFAMHGESMAPIRVTIQRRSATPRQMRNGLSTPASPSISSPAISPHPSRQPINAPTLQHFRHCVAEATPRPGPAHPCPPPCGSGATLPGRGVNGAGEKNGIRHLHKVWLVLMSVHINRRSYEHSIQLVDAGIERGFISGYPGPSVSGYARSAGV
jgi:hypothetical protein